MLHLDPVPQVWGITGNLGGGKSLSAVSLAAWGMARGYFVVSNISLNLDELSLEFGPHVRRLYQHFSFASADFDPFKLPCGSPRGSAGGKRVLVIMDECAEWVDQYTSAQDPKIKQFMSWLRHSSKRSQDVLLVVQRLDYLNKNIRLLISKWLIVDDLRVWRIPVLKLRLPFMSGYVMQRVFDRNKKLVQGPCIVRKATYGRFYNTAECLNETGASSCYEYTVPRVSDIAVFPAFFLWLVSLLFLMLAVQRLSSRIPPGPAPNMRSIIALHPKKRRTSETTEVPRWGHVESTSGAGSQNKRVAYFSQVGASGESNTLKTKIASDARQRPYKAEKGKSDEYHTSTNKTPYKP